ncbi:hypothetical protein [Oceanisphaera sp. IT1-181]|uniref:hypothetical protein n=1 Tax=Oceanisphaera sp. IT1-181 TaxID=3081199 RepID=UPI0029C9C407|nr:hypothetical protein [Oceanisphaera sp. IT1-181]
MKIISIALTLALFTTTPVMAAEDPSKEDMQTWTLNLVESLLMCGYSQRYLAWGNSSNEYINTMRPILKDLSNSYTDEKRRNYFENYEKTFTKPYALDIAEQPINKEFLKEMGKIEDKIISERKIHKGNEYHWALIGECELLHGRIAMYFDHFREIMLK